VFADYCKLSFILGCSAFAAEQPLIVPPASALQAYPQLPLGNRQAEVALVFIGGFGDEVSGIMEHVSRVLPPLHSRPEARAYYHWNGGVVQDARMGYRVIARDVAAFCAHNAGADVVLIGHSMGCATALQVAHLLATEEAAARPKRLLLLTLDPADRSVKPIRPQGVAWWGNAYVQHSRSSHDFIAQLGGRWNHCDGADANICYDGRRADEFGHYFIHDNALSLLLSRRGSVKLSPAELSKRQLEHRDSQELKQP